LRKFRWLLNFRWSILETLVEYVCLIESLVAIIKHAVVRGLD
jgi:hypothetical protein